MPKCEICHKAVRFGRKNSISRSHVSRRTNNMQKPNLKKVKGTINGTTGSHYVCTRCLRASRTIRNRT